MPTDLDEFYPFATGAGANVSEEEWREMAEDWLATGVVAGEDSELAVVEHTPSAAASVDVSTGEVRIAGHVGIVSAIKTLGIAANASGNPRIDLIVARAVFTAGSKKIELDVLQGTAAAAPVEPALTQNLTSMWEEPLAAIDVASGFVTIVTANIRNRRSLTRMVRQLAAKEPVRVATTTALAASTVSGTKRTANANGALPAIDGVTLVAADRLLDKDHATTAQQGIWRVVDPGSATRPWILERPRDFDTSSDVRSGLTVEVSEGTLNSGGVFTLTTANPIVLATTGLTFTRTGGLLPAMEVVAESVLSVAGTFDFQNIPAIGRHLLLVIAGRSLDSGSNVVNVVVRFNNDSSAIYDYNEDRILNATVTAPGDALAQTSVQIINALPGQNASADAQGQGEILIANAFGTTFEKSFTSDFMVKSAGESMGLVRSVGAYRSTAAISRITLTLSAGTFAAGSVATLYRLRGA